jgi:two-component system, chemotaxis family, protein-glutamate methylesterase/glutaminase
MAGPKFIIVIGASAGGLNAIGEMASQLPPDINAAVFIVLHLSKAALGDILVNRVQRNSLLPCKLAEDREPIKAGNIYIAPPDRHLLVKEDHVLLGHGPTENRFRPSIDVLFRSAAASYGEKTIGVVLTGFLNDGTAGMMAIKSSGGYCLVQDPNEAEYPDMPLSVLETLEVDQVAPLKNMGTAILKIINEAKEKGISPPATVVAESKLSERSAISIEAVSKLGKKSLYACPDCGGGLWEIETGKMVHYRCHIGHSYSENDLLIRQIETVENTLWIALRMLEERKLLLQKISRQNKERGLERLGQNYDRQASDIDHHISELKGLLFGLQTD